MLVNILGFLVFRCVQVRETFVLDTRTLRAKNALQDADEQTTHHYYYTFHVVPHCAENHSTSALW